MENKIRVRAAGICVHENKILLHRSEFDNFWSLPGGGINYDEKAHDCLKREMNEELGAEVEVNSLAFTAENFFEWQNKKYHSIELFFEYKFINSSTSFLATNEFTGNEKFFNKENFKLYFKWFPLHEIASIDFKPDFLKKAILEKKHNFFSNIDK